MDDLVFDNKKTGLTGSKIACGNTAYKRKESDFYPTPPDVTYALIDFLRISYRNIIWEPACGEGHMVNQIKKMGYDVFGTDIRTGTDFLKDDAPRAFNWIITNPPFSLADQFVMRCQQYNKPFALLLKSQYWHAKKRVEMFRKWPPAWVLPLTWRPDFCFGERGGSPTMEVMWCVWDRSMPDGTTYIPLERPNRLMVEVWL